jgi:hypothetical protein
MPMTRATSRALAEATLPSRRASAMDIDESADFDASSGVEDFGVWARSDNGSLTSQLDEEEAMEEGSGNPRPGVEELEKELADTCARVEEVEYEVREELTNIMEEMLLTSQREQRELAKETESMRPRLEREKRV